MTTETVLDYKTLAADWMQAKRKENEWKDRRYAIEAQLAEFFPNLPDEGQKSFTEAGYKTVAKNDIYVKVVNRDSFLEGVSCGVIPSNLVQLDLYETGFKRLRRLAMAQDESALRLYGSVQSLFTVTPAKTGFTVSKVA
jgi:hypothetical protein